MAKYKLIKEYPGSNNVGFEIFFGDNYNYCKDYPEFWEKVIEKITLFITEDGYAICDGDDVFWVDLDTTQDGADYLAYTISEIKDINKSRMPISIGKYFFIKANAEKYIEGNKPQYSKHQILDFATDAVISTKHNEYRANPLTIVQIYNNWLLKPKK